MSMSSVPWSSSSLSSERRGMGAIVECLPVMVDTLPTAVRGLQVSTPVIRRPGPMGRCRVAQLERNALAERASADYPKSMRNCEIGALLLIAFAARAPAQTLPPVHTDSDAIAEARADSVRRPYTAADIAFVSGMIHHHAQAI